MRSAIGWMLLGIAATAAVADEPTWSVSLLPGDDSLAQRMAQHYRPVSFSVKPSARQYALPLDLSELSNPNFARQLFAPADKALAARSDELLKRNGFAVFPAGRWDDVAAFYKNLQVRGVPVFITSDSLLHLYHIQFGQTLRSIEERHLIGDAVAITKAIQAEALKLHATATGDLKKAARLLVGFASVPTVLLARSGSAGGAVEALAEIDGWGGKPSWRQRDAFTKKYAELFQAIRKEQHLPPQRYGLNVPVVKKALQRYVKAHPAAAGKTAEVPDIVAEDVKAELDLIAAHKDFGESPLFTYKEDYSQYVPRGHYTRSQKLKGYFKALMWYGRMTFLIRGKTSRVDGIIPMPEARVQTLAACMLAGMMETKLADGRTLAQAWDRLYAITAFYVGLADDLTPYEYRSALRGVFGPDPARSGD